MERVLTIGPDYCRLGGGIVSVLSTYAQYDQQFRFLPTYSSENNLYNVLMFPVLMLKIVLRLLKDRQITHLHIHGASRLSFYRKYLVFILGKYIFQKKVIYHIHGAEFHIFYAQSGFITQFLVRNFLQHSDAVIVLSRQWQDYFSDTFQIKKLFVLNNTIPLPEFKSKDLAQKVTFLFLGRVGDRKGIFDVLEAINELKEQLSGRAQFFIGGDGEINRLTEKISAYGLQSMVEFVGWVRGAQKTALLQQAHVFILPSFNEGLPISILEAMSYKMPVISTPVGGIPEVLKDQLNGVMVEPGNVEEIKAALLYFVEHQSRIETMGIESYKLVEDFLPNKVINDLQQIYQQV